MTGTREKRQTGANLLSWSLPAVDPAVVGFPQAARQAAAHVYSGIEASALSAPGYRGFFAFWMGGSALAGVAPPVSDASIVPVYMRRAGRR